jgi:glycosidase
MDHDEWWRHAVFYEIYVRSFQDSNGDGVGDLQGVIDRLDYIAGLGIDAIWLTPFYPSPMADFGYDVEDHTGVDPLFGDLDAFDRLVDEAHERGLRVITDYVINHTSEEHPWFQESRASRASTKRNWYVWADPKPDGSPPNNWLGAFGGPAWTLDEATGQYYRHSFLREMPDLNWRDPQLRTAMFGVVRFWLDRGVDGFRIDAAQYPMKDPEMRDNPANHGEVKLHRPLGEFDEQIHIYDAGHPDIHGLYGELREVLDSYDPPQRVAIGEIHVFDWDRWASYYGTGDDELHLLFNFGLLSVEWSADAIAELVRQVEAELPDGAPPSWVLGNHDEPRTASRLGRNLARAALLLQLTLRGAPTLYYGDELGLPNAHIAPDEIVDPWGFQSPELSRDPERSPMPWDPGPSCGFSTSKPWLPLVEDARSLSVEAQRRDPSSMLELTRRTLALRRSTPALTSGGYRSIGGVDGCLVFERAHHGERRVVAVNLTAEARAIALDLGPLDLELSTVARRPPEPIAGALTLAPYEGCVLRPRA